MPMTPLSASPPIYRSLTPRLGGSCSRHSETLSYDHPSNSDPVNACTMTKHQTKPWYCSKNRVNAYRTILQDGGDPTVIQFLKVVRTILLNAIVGAIVWFSVASGGDPTLVPSIGLFTLSLINGFEYSDWAAFRQAYQETRENQ